VNVLATVVLLRAASQLVEQREKPGIAVMNSSPAIAAGRFKIGDSTINRLGYGAMRITT
jgi:hypothetical protein